MSAPTATRLATGVFSPTRAPIAQRPLWPRYLIRPAELEMPPFDTADRRDLAQGGAGLGLCNITKCCTAVSAALSNEMSQHTVNHRF